MEEATIENALEMLLKGFEELQEEIEQSVLGRVVEEGDGGPLPDDEQLERMDEQFFSRVKAAVGDLVESERCQGEDILAVISVVAEALEELSPELFEDE